MHVELTHDIFVNVACELSAAPFGSKVKVGKEIVPVAASALVANVALSPAASITLAAT